ncbi:MAG: diguanylate cyclase [Thiohalocapsa sp.]|nr:diguanylate cyclase [Thiohalocapsa sp.]MCF7991092.1 diguanylate cyclase [Thiohalocapsa sp.]
MMTAQALLAGRSDAGVILVVDDSPANLRLLTDMLTARGYEVHVAPNGKRALQSAQAHPPTLVLLDILMPGMDGFEVCSKLKEAGQSRDIPIVFLSAIDAADTKALAFEAGGVDYITKPFEEIEVLARIDTHVRMRNMQLLLLQQNAELERLATTDPLTGLLNRRSFREHTCRRLAESARYGSPCSLILFDIDGFKPINDNFGHDIGDRVLQAISARIAGRIRAADIFARWGGEEFTLLLPSIDLAEGCRLAEQLRALLADEPFPKVAVVTASFGVACMRKGEDFDSLIKRADQALYKAKARGRNRVEATD